MMARYRRPRVQRVPIPWNDQPDWARYAAMDEDERWFVYKYRPVLCDGVWFADESYDPKTGERKFSAPMANPPREADDDGMDWWRSRRSRPKTS